jgi:hypothetical protein
VSSHAVAPDEKDRILLARRALRQCSRGTGYQPESAGNTTGW